MAESIQGLKRSHRCGELSVKNVGETVTVMGWVQKQRNKGGIIFVDLRDRSGILQLIFEEEALEVIAERAMEKETGARALRSIIEEFMMDIMYEIPKDDNIGTVTITKEYLEHTGGPRITMRFA